MVLSASDLLGWKDFPKGLRVLLLEENSRSAAETRSKLEEMDYIVFTFYNEDEALSAISNSAEGFHVALVEMSTDNSGRRLKFLETAKDLPTIMTSNMQCLSTMMKCIALGAVEFLRKPLSEEKLKNIWQHVVQKAFNTGGKDISKSLKPIKDSLASTLPLQLENRESTIELSVETENLIEIQENNQELSAGSDKYPASSTPQIKRGVRSLDDGDCQDQTNFSIDRESMQQDGEEYKSIKTTCGNSVSGATLPMSSPQRLGEGVIIEEDELANDCKDNNNITPQSDKVNPSGFDADARKHSKASGLCNSICSGANRKKIKVDWTPELHKKFVQAVEQLGIDQAIPSRILEMMKVEGLTRHNVASHLQKYRMQRRHILPKEGHSKWPHPRESIQRSYYSQKQVMAFPPYHSTRALPCEVYPFWEPPSSYSTEVQTWGSPCYPIWQPTNSWHWKSFPGMPADAWGCPMMPPQVGPYYPFPQNASRFQSSYAINNYKMPQNLFDLRLDEEVIDNVVKEAISKPCLPLPLGLKSPSTDSVLSELSKQGISIPPNICCTRSNWHDTCH